MVLGKEEGWKVNLWTEPLYTLKCLLDKKRSVFAVYSQKVKKSDAHNNHLLSATVFRIFKFGIPMYDMTADGLDFNAQLRKIRNIV